jgi:hypothetical protein
MAGPDRLRYHPSRGALPFGECYHCYFYFAATGLDMNDDKNLKVEIDRLRSENEALKRTLSRGLSLKISEKGGLSVYGLGRFPVTLYKEQWIRLLDLSDEIRAFIRANEKQLKVKEQPAEPAQAAQMEQA